MSGNYQTVLVQVGIAKIHVACCTKGCNPSELVIDYHEPANLLDPVKAKIHCGICETFAEGNDLRMVVEEWNRIQFKFKGIYS